MSLPKNHCLKTDTPPPLTQTLNRLETLYAIAHSPQWLLGAFSREAGHLGVSPSLVWHLWQTYEQWGRR
ncbi:MAG: hypothetical protein KME35_17890 [Aphanocapsa sp. GSE-SYN-MK-11-07L]|jgi:hypothetical protein|nr:hypothetical protein [Aphanocapsa sp. GSE-SYN-MK-11-07L]